MSATENAYFGSNHYCMEPILKMIMVFQDNIEDNNYYANLALSILFYLTKDINDAKDKFVKLNGIVILKDKLVVSYFSFILIYQFSN